TCLTQMATGRQRGSPIRFVSLVGTEGSGHHLLTPVIRKIMAASLVPGQDDVDSDHETHFGFTGAGADDLLWYAFKGSNLQAFREALRKQKHGALVQQEYSFPSGDMRSVGHRFYNLTDLYQMLEASGVKQKAVIKYVRPMPQRARSVYKRWPEHCAGSLMACKAEQQAFDQLIEDHLAELDKMK
ncbi:rps2, partial [Symbiodinium necroappetens]